MDFLLFLILVLLCANLALGVVIVRLLTRDDAEQALDAKCEQAMMDQERLEEAQRRETELNEGLENVMSYEVKLGFGKKTGGEA